MARRTTSAVFLMFLAGCAVCGGNFPPVLTSVLVNGKPPSSLIMPSNEDIRILCQSEGGTPISWSVPEPAKSFGFPNGSLAITKREMDYNGAETYNGVYTCSTRNVLGTAVASPITMRIGVVKLGNVLTRSTSVKTGDTVELKCHTADNTEVRPSSLDLEIAYVWYWQNRVTTGSFGRVDFIEMYSRTQGRIAVNENNILFIRNVQPSDFDPATQLFIGCRTLQGAYVASEADFGKHELTFSGSVPPPRSHTLLYSTPSVTVTEGGSFTVACIFNDVNGTLQEPVKWNKGYTMYLENGARVKVVNAGQQHNGTWECSYKGLVGRIDVFVKLNPRLSGITDTFAAVGEVATFTCNYQFADTVKWFKNDKAMDIGRGDFTWPSYYTKVMTLRDVKKDDTGVYSCEAENEIATIRLNGRLIVTDPTIGNVSVIESGQPVGTQVIVKDNTTSIKIGCMFTADPLIVNPTIVWRMQKFPDDINELTDRNEYGIPKGSVFTPAFSKQSSLTITVYPDSLQNIIGNVSCFLKYKILNKDFRVASASSVAIIQEKVMPLPRYDVATAFPYWIIGVIIAALFLILLVFLIIFCVQRNKGEQYYVDEKERKAGHDPKEELPPWQEFNRPDQDPVKGSRASLEMEGDRPMGSDAGSMDEYGVDTDTGKFNEDGSFIGQYGPKGQRSGASGQV